MATIRNSPAFTSDVASVNGVEGLSKLEYAAIHLAAGLLANYTLNKPDDQEIISEVSVQLANTLFDELEKL